MSYTSVCQMYLNFWLPVFISGIIPTAKKLSASAQFMGEFLQLVENSSNVQVFCESLYFKFQGV